MKQNYIISIMILLTLFGMSACSSNDEANSEQVEDQEKQDKQEEQEEVAASAEPAEVEFFDFSEEVGLSLETPASEVATALPLEGTIEKADEMNADYAWLKVRKIDSIEEISRKEMEYHIPIENGAFSDVIDLHHGEGDYRVTLLLPSADEEDGKFYEAAKFKVDNLDKDIARGVEYTLYGNDKDLKLSDSITGWNQADEIIEIEGTVGDHYEGDVILAEVEKDGERSKVSFPIKDGSFKGEVPLYYGKGSHAIQLQLLSDEEEDKEGSYYDAALLYVNNRSDKVFPKITQHVEYVKSGIVMESPSWDIETEQDTIEYPIKGKIDKDAPRAGDVSHVVVKVQHADDSDDEATYYFPVEDDEFEGIAHFRFGPGEYEVTIHVPDEDQGTGSKFYFTPALAIKHEVKGIDDQRDILPSRGVESEDPTIKEQAEEITSGKKGDREKAKAIFEFVAKHVAYDVEKFREDIFHPDDSALETLDSGEGICQDYTFLAMALLRSIDMEARYVKGHAGGRHAWVETKVDGEWIEMDPTWGAGYVDGDEFHFKYNEDYFDPDEEFLEETHRRTGFLY